jgi:hypothetical protein
VAGTSATDLYLPDHTRKVLSILFGLCIRVPKKWRKSNNIYHSINLKYLPNLIESIEFDVSLVAAVLVTFDSCLKAGVLQKLLAARMTVELIEFLSKLILLTGAAD